MTDKCQREGCHRKMDGDHCAWCHWTKGIPTTPLTAQQLLSRIAYIEQQVARINGVISAVEAAKADPPRPEPGATPDVCKGCEPELTRRFLRINTLDRALSAAHMELKEAHAEVARLKAEVATPAPTTTPPWGPCVAPWYPCRGCGTYLYKCVDVTKINGYCGSCRDLAPMLEEIARLKAEVAGFKGARSTHYFMGLDANGTPLYTTVEELLRELEKAKKDAEICTRCGERMVCKDRCEKRAERMECHPADHHWDTEGSERFCATCGKKEFVCAHRVNKYGVCILCGVKP